MTSILRIDFFYCEVWNRRLVVIADQYWEPFLDAIRKTGLEVKEREMEHPAGYAGVNADTPDHCRWKAVIESVFEVQGLKREEGQSILPALERLIAEYARLK